MQIYVYDNNGYYIRGGITCVDGVSPVCEWGRRGLGTGDTSGNPTEKAIVKYFAHRLLFGGWFSQTAVVHTDIFLGRIAGCNNSPNNPQIGCWYDISWAPEGY